MPLEAPLPVQERPAVKDRIVEHLSRMLRFRTQYDAVWSKFYRQYVSDRDQKYFPDGVTKRANTFIPYPFSNVETIVSRTYDVLFGVEDFFETTGAGEQDQPTAERMHTVLKNKLHLAKLPQIVETLSQNAAIYGTCALKCDWDWDYDTVTYPEAVFAQQPVMQPVLDEQGMPQLDASGQPHMAPVMDPNTGQPATQPAVDPMTGQPIQVGTQIKQKKVPRSRPKLIPIDIYDLVVDPDGHISGYMTERTVGQLKREAEGYKERTGYDLYYPEAIQELLNKVQSEKDPDEIIVRMAEVWDDTTGKCTLMTYGDDRTAISWKDTRYAYRMGSSYSGFRRRVYAGAPILLWHGDNWFAHKRNPILWTSYIKLPHEPYGIGAIEMISDLVDALNDMTGMVRDNWNLNINRRYAYNNDVDIDHDALNNLNVPGGKVGVSGNPAEVIMPLPMMTPNAGDYALLDLYKGVIEMTSGVSDFYAKGVGGPKNNGTATGISSIIQESNYRFKRFIRNLELDILQPLLEMCSSMVQQFMKDEEEILITDAPAAIPKWERVKPEELIGTVNFRLMGSSYMQNEVMRQRNLLAFANVAGNSGYIRERESLIALGKVFKIPEIHQILKTDEEVQQEQAGQQQQQMQMMILQHQAELERIKVQAEADIEVAKARGKENAGTPNVDNIGQGIQYPLQTSKDTATPRSSGGKEGRPRESQFEGKIPGAGVTSPVRDVAQSMGANAMGLEGMGEVPGA